MDTAPQFQPEEPGVAAMASAPADPDVDDSLEDDSDEPSSVTVRPPVLASDALQRELFPTEPDGLLIRVIGAVLGVCGLGGTLLWLGLSPNAVPICTGFAALTALAIAPMAYLARAVALSLFSALGLFAANLIHFRASRDATSLGLLVSVVLLGQGLHLRSWHRSSRSARALVALGVISGIAWLFATQAISSLAVLEGHWQHWAPQVMAVPFGLLLMLALLAFMDARTTGACGAWATLLWIWYGVELALGATQQTIPTAFDGALPAPPNAATVIPLANGLLSPVLALSLAQLTAGALAVSKVQNAERVRPEPAPEGAYVEPP